MQSPQSSTSQGSPRNHCFCGCLASPCRDNKYCSERCAREDTERMLMGEPSHYRNVSRTEVLDRLARSKSLCQIANSLVVEADVARENEHKRWNEFKPLPPLPSPPQLPMLGPLENTPKQGDTPPPKPPVKRLRSSVLAKRTNQRIV